MAWHAEVLAELVGLIEVGLDGLGRGCGGGIEVDVLDVFDAGVAEAPVVDDLADGVADAVVVCVLVEMVDVSDERTLMLRSGIRPLMSPKASLRGETEREVEGETRSIQP